jgi:hypothetical protein
MADRYPLVGLEYGVILIAGRLFGPLGKTKNLILLLDTGASITTIRETVLAEVGINTSQPKERRRVETMGGPVVEGITTIPRLRVFGQEQTDLEIVFTRRPFPYRVDGVLGINFMLPYRLCVDFCHGWIELAQPQTATQ